MSKSIIPPTGEFGLNWPGFFNIPQGGSGLISAAGWTYKNEGFIQQTFLGASIRSLNIAAGFGDTSSSLSVQLVEDEYNKSDGTGLGLGDDVYHNGNADNFIPPAVGSPVFFKFGKTFATVEQAWRRLYDDIYNTSTLDNDNQATFVQRAEIPIPLKENEYLDIAQTDIEKSKFVFAEQDYLNNTDYNGDRYEPPNTTAKGANHILFGGILQSYVETKGPEGNPLYSLQVVDPREILSNVTVILNNYAGSIFNNKNYLNVYGFLEYDPSDQFLSQITSISIAGFNIGPVESAETWVTPSLLNIKTDNRLQKIVDNNTGAVFYYGNDMYRLITTPNFTSSSMAEFFPMTGQGFSRRSDQGIPWYRVRQGLDALLNTKGFLPQEYVDKGFGGPINFRGYNYVVDFTGIPIEKIPQMYFLNFDQIDLLSLCQELCDVLSHDLFISLLPVINHPASEFLFEYNKYYSDADPSKLIAGIIRVDAIDRSSPPKIGIIKEYLDSLESKGIQVENQDLGYELSNVTTDKIVVGAQEVEMYYFTGNKDRDNLELRKFLANESNSFEVLQADQWLLETSLKQQILPFYGFLGKNVPTIPKGFGPYKQILLDSSSLNAFGVGNYYIATEMELRHALSSYEDWSRFLITYNETYMEEVTEDTAFYQALPENSDNLFPGRDFAVTVPRSLFASDKNYMGEDGFPASPCCPPYGYPLYYKRAEKIGIPQAGLFKFQNEIYELITEVSKVKEDARKKDDLLVSRAAARFNSKQMSYNLVNSLFTFDKNNINESWKANQVSITELEKIENELKEIEKAEQKSMRIHDFLERNSPTIKGMNLLATKHLSNAKKVYEFVKNVAEQHLGKSFLIKIPKQANLNYSNEIQLFGQLQVNNIFRGPFGFRPIFLSSDINAQFSFNSASINMDPAAPFEHYLDNSRPYKYTSGSLKSSFNPISDKWEFNYLPEPQGGFFNYSLYDRNLSLTELNSFLATTKLPYSQAQLLTPLDLTNFEDSMRISAYVRFDHSEFLDFSQIGKDNLSQQMITAEGFIPDVLEELNNVQPDSTMSFNQIARRLDNTLETKPSVAFVKCTIDPEFYLLPKTVTRSVQVYGRSVSLEEREVIPPIVINSVDINGCDIQETLPAQKAIITSINANGGQDGTFIEMLDFDRYFSQDLNGEIIHSEKQNLSDDHIYALITLPGRVSPTVDQRYLESSLSNVNVQSIFHTLTVDVVKNAVGFDKPPHVIDSSVTEIPCEKFTFKDLTKAQMAQEEANAFISMANPSRNISFSAPAPVYPSLVVLPLMSMERCYGPWISSAVPNGTDGRVRYSDIGGKVEFVKDENLAPWNYAGYQLMNEAGFLQAQFSNSLLLFSERGGFVVPDIPPGISLAQPLGGVGPLITSVSVSIDSSVKTTVRMDLYTSRFGKLQKQKEEAIAMIVRERQKIIDRNNQMTRTGFTRRSYDRINPTIDTSNISDLIDRTFDRKKPNAITLYSDTKTRTYKRSDGTDVTFKTATVDGAVSNDEDFSKFASYVNDPNSFKNKQDKSAAMTLDQMYSPASALENPGLVKIAQPSPGIVRG